MTVGIMFATGFEMGAWPLTAAENPNNFGVVAGGVGGAYCLSFQDYDRWVKKDLTAFATPNVYCGMWNAQTGSSGGNSGSVRFYHESGKVLTAHIVSYRVLIYENDTLRATGSITLPFEGTWFHWQVADEDGTISVKIDGVTDPTATYTSGSGGNITNVTLASGGYNAFKLDNWVLRDDTWPGDIRIVGCFPDSDATPNEWTPSTGINHWAVVDEKPPSDTDYVSSGSNAQHEWWGLADWDGTNRTPVAIVQWARAMKDTADGQQIKLEVDSGGTIDSTAALDLATSYAYFWRVMMQDPNGPTPWTDAAIDALKYGVEAVF